MSSVLAPAFFGLGNVEFVLRSDCKHATITASLQPPMFVCSLRVLDMPNFAYFNISTLIAESVTSAA